MFLESFKITGLAVAQIFILGALGYFLTKKNILGDVCLDSLSELTINITLPLLIFCQLIKEFSFSLYPNWWVFPLLSFGITIFALIIGSIFVGLIKGVVQKMQFLSLTAFQNSGWLPLVLIAALLPPEQSSPMLIYLFLFLIGFNAVMFSLGMYLLSYPGEKKFDPKSLLSAPVISTIISLLFVFFGWAKFVPQFIYSPFKMVGDSTMPLAMLVVGGSLAKIHLGHIDKKAMFLLSLVKLVILPLLGLWLIVKFKIPDLIGLLIIIQLSVPSATTLSSMIRITKKEDSLITQGIFIGHLVSIITLPLLLSLYFMFIMLK